MSRIPAITKFIPKLCDDGNGISRIGVLNERLFFQNENYVVVVFWYI